MRNGVWTHGRGFLWNYMTKDKLKGYGCKGGARGKLLQNNSRKIILCLTDPVVVWSYIINIKKIMT